MGSACACPSSQSVLTPRPQGKENHSQRDVSQKEIKFADINPVEALDFEESELELKFLNNQIVGYLNEFEKDNGIISRRFTFQPEGCSSRNVCNASFNSSIKSGTSHKQSLNNAKEDLHIRIGRGEEVAKFEQQHEFSQSFYSEAEAQAKKESCLLSQQSHVLQSSIFTDRIQIKNEFYQKFKKIQDIQLEEWHERSRISYQITNEPLKSKSEMNLKFLVLFKAIRNFYETHSLHLLSYSRHPAGFKVHLNGRKRLFPLEQQQGQPSLDQIVDIFSPLIGEYDIGELAYYLTGWIPELLKMSEIRSFQGIFERLNSNLEEGNTLVFFSRQENKIIQYASLIKIDLQIGTITINTCNSQTSISRQFLTQPITPEGELTLRIQDFIILYDAIHLSWNPIIYESSISRESILCNQLSIAKYKLSIPSSSQDIEIRIFSEKHHTCEKNRNMPNLIIKLFEFENMGNIADATSIRIVEIDQNVLSDVFIFESCKEKTEYLLTVQSDSSKSEEIYSTITLFSFVEIYFNQLHSNPLLEQISLKAQITPKNMGFGINSPYFNNNLQFFLETQDNKELTINVDVSLSLIYEICLIPNPEKKQILTQLNLESIINNSILSNEKQGSGSYTINTVFKNYILLINAFSEYTGDIKVELSLHGKQRSGAETLLKLKEINAEDNKVVFFQQIKWLPSNFGPRKRLKSNSNSNYQPAEVFGDFFKNPVIDRILTQGKYRFFVRSESFKDYFDEIEETEKNECQPPALSMAVLKISDNRKQYQIIVDDAFYVPFGIGFWTGEIEMEEGEYRFVLPKMDKTFAKGTFGIIKC